MSTRDHFHGTETAVRRAEALLEHDPQLRATQADEALLDRLADEQQSSLTLLTEACRAYADRPCLGERTRADATYRVITYRALWDRVQALALGWTKDGTVRAGDFVGICGFASIDFVVADLACLYVGAVSVPLQTTISAADLTHIIRETELRAVVCSVDHLDVVRDVRVPHVFVMDAPGPTSLPRLVDVERAGSVAPPLPHLDRLVSVLYTSGTTGSPKGVMYLDRTWARRMRYTLREPPIPIITVGCMPLNHVMGRFSVYRVMMRGGVTYFVGASDMSTLLDDIRATRPTVLTLVPRATASIHQHFQAEVVRRRSAGELDPAAAVMAEMRDTFLGDRVCLLTTGSAATSPEVVAFLERCFPISVVQMYGFNEFGAVSANEHVEPDVDYKLVDVPELGYSVHDRPFPRGELLVKSHHATPGYYKLGDLDRHLLDDEGYMRSGDIMEERSPRHLVWIDRRNNVIKLSQGEFVSLTRLEELYVTESPFIAQLHLHGSSKRAYLLAVIVPDAAALASAGVGDVQRALRSELDRVADAAHLPSHERPRAFLVETAPFTRENGLLTESSKPKRAALQAKYGAPLEALYGSLEARQLDVSGSDARALVGAVLGTAELDLSRSFVALGGDSFGAVRLAELLQRGLGFSLPVGALLDPAASLQALLGELERGGHASRFAEIHGEEPSYVEANALRLERFLPAEHLRRIATPVHPARATVLTGANGFLGRSLLLELLERTTGPVYCLVRGRDDDAARARLFEGFTHPTLRAQLDTPRLRVLAGDLMRPHLGLSDETWAELAAATDAIVHDGALVNHALPYAQLFEPNVLGTVEIMRLALEGAAKSVAFVSSSGVAAGTGRAEAIREDEDASALWPRRAIGSEGGGYAAGYATSKWACEVLLRELAQRCGVPVQVFRCGMITPHSQLLGELNEGDNITRLLRGLVATHVAPRSFYRSDVTQRHFDGLPVDFVARSIIAIALAGMPGHQTFHVSNAHWDDGISLDTLARAVADEGVPLRFLDDYEAWLSTLRVGLQGLDEPLRRRTPLPILERWAQPAGQGQLIHLDNARYRDALRTVLGIADVPTLDAHYLKHVVRGIMKTQVT